MLLLLLLSRFIHGRLFATPWTVAHQAPPSIGSPRTTPGFPSQSAVEILPSPFFDPGPSSPSSLPLTASVASGAPAPSGAPGLVMGSRASTLLRDEELEEIKKETGCEFG